MSKPLGMWVRPRKGAFQGGYRVDGRYRVKTWPTEEEARLWAMAGAAERLAGAPTCLPVPAERPTAITAKLIPLYLARGTTKKLSASHLANAQHTLESLAIDVPDLAAENAHRQMEAWLDAYRIRRVGRHRRKQALVPSSGYRNRMIAEAHAFVRWLIKKEYLATDPCRTLERAKVDHNMKPQFSVDEVRQLCAPTADHPLQRWVLLQVLGGLRVNEATPLTWGNIQGGQIHVCKHPGFPLKRRHQRLVPLQAALAAILGPPGKPDERVAPIWGACSTVQYGRHFRAFLAHCGLPVNNTMGKRTPHSMRHTYAAMMIATGCPDLLVQAYMGHEAVATTAEYTRAAPLHVSAVKGWPMGELRVT